MAAKLLVYGANGFVGERVARAARAAGVTVVVAGRDEAKAPSDRVRSERRGAHVRPLQSSNCRGGAQGDRACCSNCAGPFKHTAEPLARACLEAGVHYLDITGEIPVYEALLAKDARGEGARGSCFCPALVLTSSRRIASRST